MSTKHSPLHNAFGQAVRAFRQGRDLSQEDFAVESGLHRNYVGAVERGEINPTLKTIALFAKGAEVPLSELLELTEIIEDFGLSNALLARVRAGVWRPASHAGQSN